MRALTISLLLYGCTRVDPTPDPSATPPPSPIASDHLTGPHYALSFPAKHQQYVDITATYLTDGAPTLELMMATWTPGSYLIREYARHLEDIQARNEAGPLSIEKTRKNRWTVQTDGADAIEVTYRLYSREMNVRGNWVADDFAVLNGAPTFLTVVGGHARPHAVDIALPDDWQACVTALPVGPDNTPCHFVAPDFDTLVDSPIVVGRPTLHEFEVQGVPHVLANIGDSDIWDGEKSARDVQRITEEIVAFWGEIPYEKYWYLNVIAEAGGGLEHKASTLMMTSRWRSRVDDDHKGWLGLVSHEFFHTWNVKRLRPIALGPFDYENEVHTHDLWIAEGFTSYYDDLLLKRAGLLDEDEYLTRLSDQIVGLQDTPGRRVHPLGMTSYDAWIKFYRRDENSRNVTVSYYRKGAIVAWLLDAEIQRATFGKKSLDDVMRAAYALYSGERGYTSEEFRAVASDVAGVDLGPFFARAVDSTDELDYAPALDWFGLAFSEETEAESDASDDETTEDPTDEPAWLGFEWGGDRLTTVRRGTPAHTFGFLVDDEILAVNGLRVTGSGWASRMKQYKPSEDADILISRRGALRTLEVTFDEKPKAHGALTIDDDAPIRATQARSQWLTSSAQD